MEPGYQLKSLLQTQLASDASSIRYLPYCLSTLTKDSLLPSPHLTKWAIRIHALLHSKESGAQWAGLSLAYKSALLSQTFMINAAPSWIPVVLPMLSRNEPIPTLKSSIRLLRVVFTGAIDDSEFHRQICIPNVLKFTSVVVSLAENVSDLELIVNCLDTLTQIVTLYPATHRALLNPLSALSHRFLKGSSSGSIGNEKVEAAARLFAVLPLIGGKVGAINLWRKSVDDTLASGWEAFHCLRSTFSIAKGFSRPVITDEPHAAILLNHNKLHCCVASLRSLLSTVIPRPVHVPIGHLVKFTFRLLSCSGDEKIDGFIDHSIRAMEVALVPHIWTLGCTLLINLATQFPFRLNPHSDQFLSVLAFQLDQKPNAHQQHYFLEALDSLLKSCHPSSSPVLPNRLAKAVLPSIARLLSSPYISDAGKGEPSINQAKSSKKRTRHYEGDEGLRTTRQAMISTAHEAGVLLLSIDVIQSLFKNPNLSTAIKSVIARIFTAVLLALPEMPPSLLSKDLGFLHAVSNKIQKFTFVISQGTTSVTGKALPFVIQEALTTSLEMQNDIGLLLHPRVPPLIRSMPHVEAFSLWKVEESQEEAEALSNLISSPTQDVPKNDPEDILVRGNNTQIDPIPKVSENVENATHDELLTNRSSHPPTFVDRIRVDDSRQLPLEQEKENNDTNEPLELPSVPKFPTITHMTHSSMEAFQRSMIKNSPQIEEEDEELPVINMESDSEAELY